MSIAPPREPASPRSIPGAVIPLAFASIVLVLVVAVFGALAYRDQLPFMADRPTEIVDPARGLQQTGFSLKDISHDGDHTTAVIEVTYTNPTDAPIERYQIYAQCNDNGAIVSGFHTPTSPIQPGESVTATIPLVGSGEPACSSPRIDFSSQRQP